MSSRQMAARARRSGRVHIETAKRPGFGGEAFTRYGISLGSISLADRREVRTGRAARARASKASCWRRRCAASKACSCASPCRRWASRTCRLEFDCSGTEDRAKGELTLDRCALGRARAGRDRPRREASSMPMRPSGTRSMTATCSRCRITAALGGAGWCSPTRACSSAACGAVATMTGQPAGDVRADCAQEVRRYPAVGRADLGGHDQAPRHRRALHRAAAARSPSKPSPIRRSASTGSTTC